MSTSYFWPQKLFQQQAYHPARTNVVWWHCVNKYNDTLFKKGAEAAPPHYYSISLKL